MGEGDAPARVKNLPGLSPGRLGPSDLLRGQVLGWARGQDSRVEGNWNCPELRSNPGGRDLRRTFQFHNRASQASAEKVGKIRLKLLLDLRHYQDLNLS